MSIIPSRNNTTIIQGATGFNLDDVEVNEVPYKAEDGTLQGSGLMMLSSGALLAPVGFSVESGSVDFGDVLRLSESASFLALQNLIDQSHYQMVDYAVPRNDVSSKPYIFQLIEAEHTFQATTGSTVLTGPINFEYTTQLTARTNALVLSTSGAMTNMRLRIRDKASNVALKYFPSKSAWITGQDGTSLATGDNILDFQDTALILTAGTTLIFDIVADNYTILGNNGIAKFAGLVQQGNYLGLTTATELNAVKAMIPSSSVTSVNGMTGAVTIPSAAAQVNSDWNSTTGVSQILNKPALFDGKYTSLTNVPVSFVPSAHTHVIADITGLQTALDSKLSSASAIPYTQLTGTPTIPAAQVNSDWNATSGVAMILNKPTIPTVNYPVVSVNNKTGTVVLTASDVGAIATGSAIPYSSLTGTPTPVTKTSQLTNDSGYVTSVTFPVTSVNTKTGAVVLTNLDVGAAATNHTHVISDITGLQTSLDGKISVGANIPFSTITSKPTTLAGYGVTDGVTQTSLTGTLSNYVTATSLNTTLNSYVTSSSLTTTLGNYVTSASLTSTLGNYVTTSSLTTTLSGYATTTALTSGLAAKFNTPTGTTTQYVRGDGSLATLPVIPTVVSAFTNDAGYLTGITNSQVITAIGYTPYNATNPSSYVNQAGARSSISLTTTGIGAASYSSTTGVLNVPTPTRTFANPTRALNTAFQISTTQDALVSYAVDVTVAAVLIAGTSGRVYLEYATDSAFTTGVTTVTSSGNSTGGVLSITNLNTATLAGVIPAGKYVRLRTVNVTGTPTYAFQSAQEVLI